MKTYFTYLVIFILSIGYLNAQVFKNHSVGIDIEVYAGPNVLYIGDYGNKLGYGVQYGADILFVDINPIHNVKWVQGVSIRGMRFSESDDNTSSWMYLYNAGYTLPRNGGRLLALVGISGNPNRPFVYGIAYSRYTWLTPSLSSFAKLSLIHEKGTATILSFSLGLKFKS